MDKLEKCPCGQTPKKLHIDSSDCKWYSVSGDCCGEWSIEFRSGYFHQDSDQAQQLAREAWNEAKRG